MKLKSFAAVALVALISFTACKKDKDKNEDNFSGTPVGTWKVTALKLNGGDFYSLMEACEKDDLLKFLDGGVFTYDYNSTHCDPDEENYNSTWTITADKKSLTYEGDTYTVTKLTSTTLIAQMSASQNGQTLTYELTLTRQ